MKLFMNVLAAVLVVQVLIVSMAEKSWAFSVPDNSLTPGVLCSSGDADFS